MSKEPPVRPGITFEVGARLEAQDYLQKWYCQFLLVTFIFIFLLVFETSIHWCKMPFIGLFVCGRDNREQQRTKCQMAVHRRDDKCLIAGAPAAGISP